VTPAVKTLAGTLGALALAVAANIDHVPLWISGGVYLALAARLYAEQRGRGLPRRGLKLLLVLVMVVAVFAAYRTLNGLAAGTALLTLMAGLKLAETRSARDQAILVFIGYFLCAAALLYDQGPLRFVYVLIVSWLLTSALIAAQRPAAPDQPAGAAGRAARLLLLGAPLAIVLFLFVPRIEGRLWTVAGTSQAQSGLAEDMHPGDISALGLSDDPAFRAWFAGATPPPDARYWRALVFESFDGRTWRRGATSLAPVPPAAAPGTPVYDYRILLEPTGRSWLVVLDHVIEWPGTLTSHLRTGQLVRLPGPHGLPAPVSDPFSYPARSAPRLAPDDLAPEIRAAALRLPPDAAPQTRALARSILAQASDPGDFVRRVLGRFHDEPYRYTLDPPPLGADPVDSFLFETRAGYCEHYASAFTVLMRAAGIPARVVAGYQGGEFNRYGGYWLIRQSSAHAWSEIWLAGQGWIRVDPTAAVAPERVESGLQDALGTRAGPARIFDWPMIAQARALVDAARTAWSEDLVGYSSRTQRALLERLGLTSFGTGALALALGLGLAAAGALLVTLLALELKRGHSDRAQAAWLRFCARLARVGLKRDAAEGPVDFARRVAARRPELAADVSRVVEAYVAARYWPAPGANSLARLEALVRAFRAPPATLAGRGAR
jgi:protein-glutamine gamma-glutamyltransferase